MSNLRALAERVIEVVGDPYRGYMRPAAGERTNYTLAQGVLTLLTSLEVREVELRMLKQSNTVLNEKLEAAEREVVAGKTLLNEKERFVKGYYGEAAEGWAKFRAAERERNEIREAHSSGVLELVRQVEAAEQRAENAEAVVKAAQRVVEAARACVVLLARVGDGKNPYTGAAAHLYGIVEAALRDFDVPEGREENP